MKLFVDDVRPVPDDSWAVARTYSEARDLFDNNMITIMSLDHDLGEEKTGYDFLLYVVEQYYPEKVPIQCKIHSANPVGRDRMLGVIARYFVRQSSTLAQNRR